MANKKFKWRTDFDKPVLIDNFNNRGWKKCDEKEEVINI